MQADPEDYLARARLLVDTIVMHPVVVLLLAEMAAEIHRLEEALYHAKPE